MSCNNSGSITEDKRLRWVFTDPTLLSSQMEQIKRANRMYTNDSIYLKKSLSIPLLDSNSSLDSLLDHSRDDQAAEKVPSGQSPSDRKQDDGGGGAGTSEELSPKEFLKRLDGLIHQSKQAAIRGCRDAEKRFVSDSRPCVLYSNLQGSF